MKINIKVFASDPMEFFDSLYIPSAQGNVRFADVMAEHQRDWFDAVAPSLLAVAAGKRPAIGSFWTERTKGGSKDTDVACMPETLELMGWNGPRTSPGASGFRSQTS